MTDHNGSYLRPGTRVLMPDGKAGRVLQVVRNKAGAWYDIQTDDGYKQLPVSSLLTPLNLDDPADLERWLNAP